MRALLALCALCAVGSAAGAQPAPVRMTPVFTGQRPWTLTCAEAGGFGDQLSVQLGWPSVSLGYTHPLGPDVDLGARLDLLYGVESSVDVIKAGLGVRAPLRWTAVRQGAVSVLLHADPGVKYYSYSPAQLGLALPLGATVGLRLANDLWAAASLDLPMTLFFHGVAGTAFALGVQPGFSLEYALDKQIGLSLDTRLGPVLSASYFANPPVFGFRAQVGLSYRL
jgi:hypothetical protein